MIVSACSADEVIELKGVTSYRCSAAQRWHGRSRGAQERERMRRSEVVATSANRVDGRVSVSTTSQFKPRAAQPSEAVLSIFVPLYELLNSLRCLFKDAAASSRARRGCGRSP